MKHSSLSRKSIERINKREEEVKNCEQHLHDIQEELKGKNPLKSRI